jgi:hypothetical protein
MRMRHICGRLYNIFPRYLINGTIFWKKLLDIKCVLSFSTTFSETFLILRRNEGDMIKNVYWSLCKSTHYSCPILMKVEFSGQIFEKYSNFKYHEHPSITSWVFAWGRTNRWTDITKLVVAFRNSAKKPKTVASSVLYFYMQEMSLIWISLPLSFVQLGLSSVWGNTVLICAWVVCSAVYSVCSNLMVCDVW